MLFVLLKYAKSSSLKELKVYLSVCELNSNHLEATFFSINFQRLKLVKHSFVPLAILNGRSKAKKHPESANRKDGKERLWRKCSNPLSVDVVKDVERRVDHDLLSCQRVRDVRHLQLCAD
jgi:hypothetical protein